MLVLAPVFACVNACEVVADFDPKRLNTDRTVGPVPLPTADGAVALIPDAGELPDGALISAEVTDAQVAQHEDGGIGLDAASTVDATVSTDASEPGPDAAGQADSAVSGLLDAGA